MALVESVPRHKMTEISTCTLVQSEGFEINLLSLLSVRLSRTKKVPFKVTRTPRKLRHGRVGVWGSDLSRPFSKWHKCTIDSIIMTLQMSTSYPDMIGLPRSIQKLLSSDEYSWQVSALIPTLYMCEWNPLHNTVWCTLRARSTYYVLEYERVVSIIISIICILSIMHNTYLVLLL